MLDQLFPRQQMQLSYTTLTHWLATSQKTGLLLRRLPGHATQQTPALHSCVEVRALPTTLGRSSSYVQSQTRLRAHQQWRADLFLSQLMTEELR